MHVGIMVARMGSGWEMMALMDTTGRQAEGLEYIPSRLRLEQDLVDLVNDQRHNDPLRSQREIFHRSGSRTVLCF